MGGFVVEKSLARFCQGAKKDYEIEKDAEGFFGACNSMIKLPGPTRCSRSCGSLCWYAM